MSTTTSRDLPEDGHLDATLALLREGYRFVGRRAARLGSRAFNTRLLLRPAVALTGHEGARLFYDESRVHRAGAAPGALQRTIFGVGGVQGLDGTEHRHRKAMLMSLMTEPELARLAALNAEEWERATDRWQRQSQVVLLDGASELLCRAICRWAGVPLDESEVPHRTRLLVDMVEGAASPGPRYLRAYRARAEADRWAADLVSSVRRHEQPPRAAEGKTVSGAPPTAEDAATPRPDALRVIAWHRDLRGNLLPEEIAAVELLNILRPTVAVARWVVYLAVALHTHADARGHLASGDWRPLDFIEETRRLYPFFPLAAGRTTATFDWHGYRIPGGQRILLDLYGTNRDPDRWPHPHRFDPSRFRDREVTPFEFVPHGGGDYLDGHRCAGEPATLALLETALEYLSTRLTYDVPPQDLRIPLDRIPSGPNSGFILTNLRRT